MRLIGFNDGVLELRWTWLPYWLVVSPKMQRDVERLIQDALLLNGLEICADSDDKIEEFTLRTICRLFPLPGLRKYLEGLRHIEEP